MPQKTQKKPTVEKDRLTGYLPVDLIQEVRDLLDTLPRSVTLSDVIEGALRRELTRVRQHGWGPTQRRPRAGRPLK